MTWKIENQNGKAVGIDENGDEVSIDFGSIDTDGLQGSYPTRVRAFDSAGVVASIDPADTTTPVQDAIDAIGRSNGGTVILPPKTITEASAIVGGRDKRIIGYGIANGSAVEIDGDGTNGIEQDASVTRDWRNSYLDGWSLNTADPSNRTSGSAIYLADQPTRGMNMGLFKVFGWNGTDPIIHYDTAHAFEFHAGFLRIEGEGAGWQMDDAGPGMNVAQLVMDVSDGGIGLSMLSGGELTIRHYSALRSTGRAFTGGATNARSNIGVLHYETDQVLNGSPGAPWLGTNMAGSCHRVGMMALDGSSGASSNYAYRLHASNQNAILGPVITQGGYTLNNNVVNISSDPDGTSWYFGASSDIDVNHGGTNEGEVRSLASAGTGNG